MTSMEDEGLPRPVWYLQGEAIGKGNVEEGKVGASGWQQAISKPPMFLHYLSGNVPPLSEN